MSPEVHCVKLRRQRGLENLRLIRVRHGAGDREGVFDERLRAFDFMLLPGQKYVDRLRGLGLLPEGDHALAGYPKFEVIEGFNRPVPRLFQNDRPVVLYNPHFDAAQSSWQTMGLQVTIHGTVTQIQQVGNIGLGCGSGRQRQTIQQGIDGDRLCRHEALRLVNYDRP